MISMPDCFSHASEERDDVRLNQVKKTAIASFDNRLTCIILALMVQKMSDWRTNGPWLRQQQLRS